MVDRLTKGVIIKGLPAINADALYEAVDRRLISVYGLPDELINDNGGPIISRL